MSAERCGGQLVHQLYGLARPDAADRSVQRALMRSQEETAAPRRLPRYGQNGSFWHNRNVVRGGLDHKRIAEPVAAAIGGFCARADLGVLNAGRDPMPR